MKRFIVIMGCFFIGSGSIYSQAILFEGHDLQDVNVFLSKDELAGKEVVRVIKDSAVKESDQPSFARIKGIDFENGTIEVNVQSKLLKNAPEFARGFIGIAFRIDANNSRFECIYLRPTNGRADQQLRRNHSIQYFSFPDYPFDRLRKEAPGEYESYSDMAMNEWIHVKIVVKDQQAKLFLNENSQPALVVNDLKLGAHHAGSIGLFVDIGTEGYFSDFKISK